MSQTYSGAAASFWRVMAIARRHAYVLQRSPHRAFDVVVWPAVDVVLFGTIGIFASTRTGGGSQVALYLLVGVVLWHVVYQAQISLATDNVFRDGADLELATMTGDMTNGYTASLVVGVPA